MKILVYFSGDLEEPKGTPIRVANIVSQLIMNGAEVHYASKKIPSNFKFAGFLKVGKPLNRPFEISNYVKKNGIDLIYIQTSAGLWLAPFLKILTKSKIGLDFHSLNIEEEKMYKNLSPIRYYLLKWIELLECIFLDFATGVSYKLGEYYALFVRNYFVLPGGVDLRIFNSQVEPDPDILAWKGNSIVIGYAGNTKWYQGLNTVLQALSVIERGENKGKYKLFIIASSVEPSILEYIKKENLESSVKIIEKQPHNKIPSLLMSTDILTIVRPSDPVTEFAFPSKFPEHAALGKPLIVSKVGDIIRYVEDNISAIVVEPENKDELVKAILELGNNNFANKIGMGAAELAKNRLDINILGGNLYNFLTHLCKQ